MSKPSQKRAVVEKPRVIMQHLYIHREQQLPYLATRSHIGLHDYESIVRFLPTQ